MQNSVISVVIPAYNEEKTIGSVIEETVQVMDTFGAPYEIIVVDDGSSDHTKEIASRYKARLLSNGRNKGKGYAIRKGFQHAQGDIVVTIDADGSHSPKEIPDLIKPLFDGADIVAGSRFIGEIKDHTSKLKILGNHFINTTIMVLTRRKVTDSQTGFRAIKRNALGKLDLKSYGYEIETEITVRSLRRGLVFKEIPISIKRRRYSFSKLKIMSDGKKILKCILKASF